MVKKSYLEQIKDPRWQKKRLDIMERDEFTCKSCGDKESTLNVHHLAYDNKAMIWEYNDIDLITLCEGCHTIISENTKEIIKIIRSDSYDIAWSHEMLCFIRLSVFLNPGDLILLNDFIRNFKRTGQQIF